MYLTGAGLYPCLALLNHSCDPSFMRCNKGRDVICVTSKTIKKGQEISENYGLMYTIKDLTQRQKICSEHYKFKCGCRACDENWPLLGAMKAEVHEDPQDSKYESQFFCHLDSITDLGSLIGNSQFGNFRIFSLLRFYMKLILIILKPLKLPF